MDVKDNFMVNICIDYFFGSCMKGCFSIKVTVLLMSKVAHNFYSIWELLNNIKYDCAFLV